MASSEHAASSQGSFVALYLAALGFFLWGLGWFVLIPNHESQVGWLASQVLESVKRRGHCPSTVMYNKVCSPGSVIAALPNCGVCFGQVISACCKLGQWQPAKLVRPPSAPAPATHEPARTDTPLLPPPPNKHHTGAHARTLATRAGTLRARHHTHTRTRTHTRHGTVLSSQPLRK